MWRCPISYPDGLSSLDPALLSTFLAVVSAGRISAAARQIHLSQPAVTAQIRKLEDAIGAPLFVRSARGVQPTAAGLQLAEDAREIQRLLDAAMSRASGSRDTVGPLELAASTTIAAHVLPPLLARFRGLYPAVPLRVRMANTEDVVRLVRAGEVPLGLVEGHARAAGIRLEPLAEDEIVPIAGVTAPFQPLTPHDLDAIPLLWREAGSGTRAVIERALAKAGVRRRAARALDVELGGTEAVIGGVIAGLGIAFVSRWSVRAHLAAGLVRIVPGLALVMRRTFRWALPAGGLAGAAARFHALAQRTGVAPP